MAQQVQPSIMFRSLFKDFLAKIGKDSNTKMSELGYNQLIQYRDYRWECGAMAPDPEVGPLIDRYLRMQYKNE